MATKKKKLRSNWFEVRPNVWINFDKITSIARGNATSNTILDGETFTDDNGVIYGAFLKYLETK